MCENVKNSTWITDINEFTQNKLFILFFFLDLLTYFTNLYHFETLKLFKNSVCPSRLSVTNFFNSVV